MVASDHGFTHVVDSGRTSAAKSHDFTMKPLATGLKPATKYYYRFSGGGATSDIGAFETLPSPNSPSALNLAFTGDNDALWTEHPDKNATPFEVLRRIAEENPDLFLYMGDTIYSDSETGAPTALTKKAKWAKYRKNRAAATQLVLRKMSTWAVWDDHEVVNDFDGAQLAIDDPGLLSAGKAAFNDYWPIKEDKYYRKVDIGSKIDLIFLDERGYRSQSPDEIDSPCRDAEGELDLAPMMPPATRGQLGLAPADPACIAHMTDPTRTMLGAEQLAWLKDALSTSDATWKLIVNEVPITQIFVLPYDRWDGYIAERADLLSYIGDNAIDNVVFLTTDIHANIGARVYVDITVDNDNPVAYEVVAGPVQTCTLDCEVAKIRGEGQGAVLQQFLVTKGLVDADCIQINSYGYSMIEIPKDGSTLKARWKSNKRAPGGGGKQVVDCAAVTLVS
ncbi:MAG: alkaline phosphatase [Actinomycetota bacterium]|jgi:alkaline phosphatase D|nr:alkaline phosphatase [Actinomycetota bacterium]